MNNKKLNQQKYGKHNRAFYKLSRRHPETIFHNLYKGFDSTEYLIECFESLNPKVVGPDGITIEIYRKDLDKNISILAQRVRDGYVPSTETLKCQKELKGKLQTFEISPMNERMLHMAISMRLNAIFDPVFSPLSYAFRKGYGVHRMIADIDKLRDRVPYGSIAKADIHGYYSSITRVQAEECLRRKISDEKFIKLTLDLAFLDRDKGLVCGSSISPVISNIVGHYLLDEAFEKICLNYRENCLEFKERNIDCRMLRYADDLFFISNHPDWAWHMQVALELEIEKYGFQYNEFKTEVQPFGYKIEKAITLISYMEITNVSYISSILGFSLGNYSYIDMDGSEKLKSHICYPTKKQKEHGDQILDFFKSGFDMLPSTLLGSKLVESTYSVLRDTRRVIKRKIQYYTCSNILVLEAFLRELAKAIKDYVMSKGLRLEVADRIIQNSGIQDLMSYA